MGRGKDLAQVLGISQKDMTRIIVQRSALYRFDEKLIGEKTRSLAVPLHKMREIHDRIKDLLNRIELPDYLYSPRKGRSPVDNAELHLRHPTLVKLDIKQFYPSTSSEHVFQFFRYRMRMAEDVAGRLTKLCTIPDRVAFGSPLSPILCAHVHNDLFSRAAKIFSAEKNPMSLWVDDLAGC